MRVSESRDSMEPNRYFTSRATLSAEVYRVLVVLQRVVPELGQALMLKLNNFLT